MTVRFLTLALIGASVVLGPLTLADPSEAETPKEEREAKQVDDPLPPGAKLRFGVSRHILRGNPAVGLVPPGYTTLLAPTVTGGIRRYDVKTGWPRDKQGIVGSGQVVVSADGKRAAVARTGALTVVDTASGKAILTVDPPEGLRLVGKPGIALSADGKVLAFGAQGMDRKGAAVVLDVDKNEVLATVETDIADPVFPVLSRDGKTLVTLGPPPPAPTLTPRQPGTKPAPPPDEPPDTARTAQVWEVAGGKERFKARVTGMGGAVVAGAFSADGARLALSAGDGPIDVWDVKTGKRLQTLLGQRGQGVRVAFSPDGKTLASMGRDFRLQRWGADGKPLEDVPAPVNHPVGAVTGLAFADNERVIVWMTVHQLAFVWEATAPTWLSPDMIHQAGIRSIALPAEDKTLMTSGLDGKLIGWDLETGEQNNEFSLHPVRLPGQPLIRPVAFLSADARRAVWLQFPAPEVFDLPGGQSQFVVPLPSTAPAPVHISTSAEGTKLLTISRQAEKKRFGGCVVWDLATRQRLAEFDVEPAGAAAAPVGVLSPDGSRLALVTVRTREDKTALLFVGYDLKTGKKLAEVEDPVSASGSVSVAAADNDWLVAISSTGRVWTVNYAKGQVGKDLDKIPVRGEPAVQRHIAFSPDSKRFAISVVGQPYTTYGVRVYDWPEGKLLKTFIGHRGPVTAQRFSADGNFLATGAQDTSVLLWDLTKPADGK
jgi:WD40 repeat protein